MKDNIFLIDATFLFEKAFNTFYETSLFVENGQDNSFIFGFLRDLFRLRSSFAINYGFITVGEETYDVATAENINSVIKLMEKMRIPFIYYSDQSVIDICATYSSNITHIVSENLGLFQFCSDDLKIIIPSDKDGHKTFFPNDLMNHIGVDPEKISTYLALTGTKNKRIKTIDFTRKQAIRLIELYGSIEDIYSRLSEIKAKTIQEKLKLNKKVIFSRYFKMIVDNSKLIGRQIEDDWSWKIDTRENRILLESYGFYSLVKILSLTD